jgi:UDP-N-acetylglucosamine acyltransferase
LRRAFKVLYRQNLTLDIALQRLETMFHSTPEVVVLIDSIRASERGIVR